MRGVVFSRTSRPHPARLALFAAGRTVTEFAAYHGTSAEWVGRVLAGYQRAPARFRSDLATFLGLSEDELFPPEGVEP